MIMNRLIDWDALNRAAQALYAGQRNSPFVQDPGKLSSDPAANRNLFYPNGTATNPRSNALTPGVFAPGAGYMAGSGGGAPPPAASGAAPAPYQVAGYQPIVPSSTATAPASGGTAGATGGGSAANADLLAAAVSGGAGAPSERVNDFSKLKAGEQMSWDALPSTSWGQPKNGQITFEAGMPRMPGTRGPNSTGIDVGDGQGGNYNPNGSGSASSGGQSSGGGSWRYLGNDPSKYGGYAAGGEQPVADNAKGVWQWEEAPTARNLPGLRDLILSMMGAGQQVPDSTMTAPSGGMLPNNQGMAPGDELFRG